VALKAMHPALAGDATGRQRFLREARSIAAVKHDHIVSIHAVEEDAPVPYLVMEFVEGQSLRELVAHEPPLSPQEIARIGAEAALALAAAHARGLVHRDVKPANILLEEPRRRVKLTDFGLARAVEGTHLTDAGLVAGTPHFMSPEQALGRPVDARSDLFSLGAVLYTLAAGQPPFEADSSVAVLRRVADDAPQPLTALRSDLPVALVELIEALLEKDPARRPGSAAEVAQRLGLLAAVAPQAGQPPWSGDLRSRKRRQFSLSAKVALAAAVGLPLVLGGGTWAWLASRRPPDAGITKSGPSVATQSPKPAVSPPADPPPAAEQPPAPRTVAEFFPESGVLQGQGQLVSLYVARDGSAMYVSGSAGRISAWNVHSAVRARTFGGHTGKITEMALSPDGSRLASHASDRMLYVWDTSTGRILTKQPTSLPLRQLAFSPDGTRLLAAPWGLTVETKQRVIGVYIDPRAIAVYDVNTLQLQQSLRPPKDHAFFSAAFDPTGQYVAAGTQSGDVVLFDAVTGEHLFEFSGQIGPNFNVRFSADGTRLWSTGNENSVVCRKVPSGDQVYRRLLPRGITRLTLSHDETWVALGGGLDVRLIDLTGQVGDEGIVSFSGHTASTFGVAFLPGDRELISCAQDGTVRLWKVPERPSASAPP
jgi:serine/threonine protein kinase